MHATNSPMFQGTMDIFAFPAWSIPVEQQMGLFKVTVVLAVIAAIYALWRTMRVRHPYPLFVFLGAGFSILYEPLGDILTKVAYAPVDQVSIMTAFGRPTPLWMLPNYLFFFSLPALLLEQFVVKPGTTPRKYWLTFIGVALFVAVFEQPGINGDIWRYYGTQAFSINSYPVWVAFANAASLFVIAAAVAMLRRTIITPGLALLFVPIVPIVFIGTHVGGTLPIGAALYSTSNQMILDLAALLSMAICTMIVWLAYRLLALMPAKAGE